MVTVNIGDLEELHYTLTKSSQNMRVMEIEYT